MMISSVSQRLVAPTTPVKAWSRQGRLAVQASSGNDLATVDRRGALVAGGVLLSSLAVPELATADTFNFTIAPEKLSAGQAKAQRQEVQDRTERILATTLTAADAPAAMRLVFNDAGTYDYATRTGGLDGSIVMDEELKRPENASLKPLVEKLKEVKKTVDEQNAASNQAPISWSDLLVLTARLAVSKEWRVQKRKRTASDQDAALLQTAFGADWPVRLGRVDSNTPGEPNRIPQADASVEDIRSFLLQLGAKPEGGFGYKPPFYERPGFLMYTAAQPDPTKAEEYLATEPEFAVWKDNYDKSRKTLTRTNYEVDFITYFTRLTSLGAKFDTLAYLRPVVVKSKGGL